MEITITVQSNVQDMKMPERRVILSVIASSLADWADRNIKQQGIEQKWLPLAPSTLLMSSNKSSSPLARFAQLIGTRIDEAVGTASVSINHPSASYHNEGTGVFGPRGAPYLITVRNKRTLAGALKAGGWLIFGPAVMHTGVPKRPLLPSRGLAEKIATDAANGVIEQEISGRAQALRDLYKPKG